MNGLNDKMLVLGYVYLHDQYLIIYEKYTWSKIGGCNGKTTDLGPSGQVWTNIVKGLVSCPGGIKLVL